MRQPTSLLIQLCLFLLFPCQAKALAACDDSFETGIFQIKTKGARNKSEFILIKAKEDCKTYEIYIQNKTRTWKMHDNFLILSTRGYLPEEFNSCILINKNKSMLIAFNWKSKEICKYDFKNKSFTFYKSWFKDSYEIKDERSGTCKIAPIDEDSFYFKLQISSQNNHNGTLEGIAIKEKENFFLYRDFDYITAKRLNAADDYTNCTLKFELLSSDKLNIYENQCGLYHGAGITFDGTYQITTIN